LPRTYLKNLAKTASDDPDTYKCVYLSIEDNIAHLRMSRPTKHTSMTLDFWSELPEIIVDIDYSGKARVIVLSSANAHFNSAWINHSFLRLP
tara:strand:- start:138 stop:413 length:276 start_codon:yes stop_codon:yes gene_type:complete